MKNFYKSLAIVALAIGFTSCSEDVLVEEFTQETPLKSYSLSRDIDGSYTLEHTLSDGMSSSITNSTDGSQIILNEGTSSTIEKSDVLPLTNGNIKIDFLTENEVKIPGISILDSKISSTTSSKEIDYVKSYKISMLEDGTYQLDYTLANNYVPSYDYDEELGKHQIILTKDFSNESNSYSKNYLKFEGQKLNIVFLRLVTTTTLSSKGSSKYYPEPPEVTID